VGIAERLTAALARVVRAALSADDEL